MKKTLCDKCNIEISNNVFQRHRNSCDGVHKSKVHENYSKYYNVIEAKFSCNICNKTFSTKTAIVGHVSRSHLNVHFQEISGAKGFLKRVELGHNFSYPHSNEAKNNMSIKACERLSKHSKYTRNVEYKPGVILESSYEVRVAEILDELCVKWIKVRKGYIWDDNGTIRRYIPDFYLPIQDIFLDPKNDFLIKKDKRKIESAMKLNNIRVIVLSNKQITIEFLRQLSVERDAVTLKV